MTKEVNCKIYHQRVVYGIWFIKLQNGVDSQEFLKSERGLRTMTRNICCSWNLMIFRVVNFPLVITREIHYFFCNLIFPLDWGEIAPRLAVPLYYYIFWKLILSISTFVSDYECLEFYNKSQMDLYYVHALEFNILHKKFNFSILIHVKLSSTLTDIIKNTDLFILLLR